MHLISEIYLILIRTFLRFIGSAIILHLKWLCKAQFVEGLTVACATTKRRNHVKVGVEKLSADRM